MDLNKFSLNSSPAVRFLAAALGGLLLSASFPPLGMAWAAWIAPGLILFSGLGARSGRAFRIGFVAGLVHFLSSLYWLLNMPFTWHGIPVAPGAGWLALSAYCALYPAIWVWLCWQFFPGTCGTADQFVATGWLRRLVWAFAAGAIWNRPGIRPRENVDRLPVEFRGRVAISIAAPDSNRGHCRHIRRFLFGCLGPPYRCAARPWPWRGGLRRKACGPARDCLCSLWLAWRVLAPANWPPFQRRPKS